MGVPGSEELIWPHHWNGHTSQKESDCYQLQVEMISGIALIIAARVLKRRRHALQDTPEKSSSLWSSNSQIPHPGLISCCLRRAGYHCANSVQSVSKVGVFRLGSWPATKILRTEKDGGHRRKIVPDPWKQSAVRGSSSEPPQRFNEKRNKTAYFRCCILTRSTVEYTLVYQSESQRIQQNLACVAGTSGEEKTDVVQSKVGILCYVSWGLFERRCM